MAASHNLGDQFSTLPMFLPASVLRDEYVERSAEADESGEYMDDMWDRKLDESRAPVEEQRPNADFTGVINYPRGSGVHASIKEHGYDWSKPVNVVHRTRTGERFMGQGHHRVAAAADIDPRMEIPINHIEDDF